MRTLLVAACLAAPGALWAAPAHAQDATAAAAAADAAAQAAAKLADAEFTKGSEAYAAKNDPLARTHFERALAASADAWPKLPAYRNKWQACAWRAIAWTHAREGDADQVRRAAKQAFGLIVAANGDRAEERYIGQAYFDCLSRLESPEDRLALIRGWRTDVEGLLPNPIPRGTAVYARLQKLVGQTWHEEAYAQQQQEKFEAAAKTLETAIRYRDAIGDRLGGAWSSQNRFWVLLQLGKYGEAAAQFGHTVRLVRIGGGLEVESTLAVNLEAWIAGQVQASQYQVAADLLQAIRQGGTLSDGGLTTLTQGRCARFELEMMLEVTRPPPERLAAIGEELLKAGKNLDQPAWTFAGALLLGQLALDRGAEGGRAARTQADAAIAAAEQLNDSDRRARATLLRVRALVAGKRHDAAHKEVAALLERFAQPGWNPYQRERARRAGVRVAVAADNAEWKAHYARYFEIAAQQPIEGHTWLGRSLPEFWQAVETAGGNGPVLSLTRRGQSLVLRSPFVQGTLRARWSWRLRYLNANGLMLALHGPTIAVVGRRTEPGCPAAQGGEAVLVEGGYDLEKLRGPRLPRFAPRITLQDGETAFVNRFLRIHR